VATTPLILAVHPSQPVTTVAELITLAKARPGELFFPSAGTGDAPHLAAELFNIVAGVKLVHVPYKGEPAALIDLVANNIQVMFATPTTAQSYAREGKLRVLATTLPQRSPGAPEVPTLAEAGLPKFSVSLWAAIYGPPGMPSAIAEQLAKEIGSVLSRQDVKEKLEAQQFFAQSSSPKELEVFTAEQLQIYARTLKEAGVQAE